MMILYTIGYWLTGLVNWSLARKVRGLEGRYAGAARSAEKLAHELSRRPGNSNTQDPYTAAKGYYELGKQVDNRDKLEARYVTWQRRADRFAARRNRIANWKGRFVPYLAGAVDLAIVAVVLHLTGVVEVTGLQAATEVASAR